MKLKFIIPAVLIAVAAGVLAFESLSKNRTSLTDKDEVIADLVGQVLEKLHYDPKEINDDFSREVFHKYIKSLDGEKKFFLQKDIAYLKKYETSIDEEIRARQPLDFYQEADSILSIRMQAAQQLYPAILSKPFDFHKQDSIQLDRDKVDFPEDKAARKEVWFAMLKYRTLGKLLELKDERSRAVDTASIKKESNAQLEADAREEIKKSYDLYFDRLHSHFTEDERFSSFMNIIAGCMDPHSNYFSPQDRRYFDEQMSGTFFGIGALLSQDEYHVKIESIVTGGPAWKEGNLQAGDIILKVGQGNKPPVDMTGFTVQDAVKIIRGNKGTVVKLTVKHLDATIETIAIKRGEVKIEATFARSYLINDKGHKIGFIVLPEFYFNKNGTTGPGSSAFDVREEIKKLKAIGAEGVILDLRFNGGGSLGDAIDMAGLFIPSGPIVQVRAGNGHTRVLKDHDTSVVYSGPLAIMVNEYSASASEILSAAMQDYERAVIVGSKNTFGKGTVQRMIDLSALLSQKQKEALGPLGALKLTIQKFYRISGGSTQLKGVSSDIVLPDPYYDVAERTDKDALSWDRIEKADYQIWKDPVAVNYLQKRSEKRVDSSRVFSLIEKNIALMKHIDKEKKMPLNIEQYQALQDSNAHQLKAIDEIDQMEHPLRITNLEVDMSDIHHDSIRSKRNRELLQAYSTDPYLNETVNVMNDMIGKSTLQEHKLTKSAAATP